MQERGDMARRYVNTRLGQVHLADQGSGEVLLLLPPAGRSGRVYAPLAALLSKDYRVIAIDLPGFGNSDALPADATMKDLADCVVEVLDGLSLAKAHVFGLHTGNKVAACLAVRHAERIGKLVLCGQSHSLIPDQQRRNAVIGEIARAHVGTPDRDLGAREELLRQWADCQQAVVEAWSSEAAAGAEAGGSDPASPLAVARAVALDWLQSMDSTSRLYAINFAYDLGRDMARIRVPTLIIEVATPHEDQTIGRQAPEVTALIQQATVETLHEPQGHALTLENRATDIAAILARFLTGR
jgi:pimeloyl-ACP methyl ester carboxylesterase